MTLPLSVVADSTEMEARAAEIACQLNLDYPACAVQPGLQLMVSRSGLSISRIGVGRKPVAVDFASGKMIYRRMHTSRRSESIAKAVGIKPNHRPRVIDATAGMGKDSFVLAALGCEVTMLERSKVVALLLEDGLNRATRIDELVEIVHRMKLHHVDACEWLEHAQLSKDAVIYLDPMFPSSSSSALPTAEMQILQELLGQDEDIEKLFGAARRAGPSRIVIKRPRRTRAFTAKPDFSITGKSSRFDVFVNLAG